MNGHYIKLLIFGFMFSCYAHAEYIPREAQCVYNQLFRPHNFEYQKKWGDKDTNSKTESKKDAGYLETIFQDNPTDDGQTLRRYSFHYTCNAEVKLGQDDSGSCIDEQKKSIVDITVDQQTDKTYRISCPIVAGENIEFWKNKLSSCTNAILCREKKPKKEKKEERPTRNNPFLKAPSGGTRK